MEIGRRSAQSVSRMRPSFEEHAKTESPLIPEVQGRALWWKVIVCFRFDFGFITGSIIFGAPPLLRRQTGVRSEKSCKEY
ncbi:hypothetical protein C8N47_11744 [Mangrovibacterium marinum]|uniref:Uncharacterized protein n=1 Tax=Mangrovibacterium marinum TaxID=1639118 RepID=A0A2T5BYZ2_9BACT|nr:hypothetical protein C8N47_11744 [Mangrovibacterium marinum]